MQHAEKNEEQLVLEKKVWNPTPWVIDVYVGKNDGYVNADEGNIREYCIKNFGKQSWPIHGRPANWYRAGMTVLGWTWFGFKTKEMMEKFIEDWPENTKHEKVN